MAFGCMPYGLVTSNIITYNLKDFYHETGTGCCGCIETVGKWMVVAPAHLLTGAIVVPLMAVYDAAMVCFFALANLFTACTIEELRDRFCGHFTSLMYMPNEMRNHLVAGCFTPIIYHGANVLTG